MNTSNLTNKVKYIKYYLKDKYEELMMISNWEQFQKEYYEALNTLTASTNSLYILTPAINKLRGIKDFKEDELVNNTQYRLVNNANYYVSTDAKVYSIQSAQFLTPIRANNGYLMITLTYKDGTIKTHTLHKLVWTTYNGDVPYGLELNHIDANKENCKLSNLETLTHKENCNSIISKINYRMGNRFKCGDFKPRPIKQLTLDGELVKMWSSARQAKMCCGYAQNYIGLCAKGKKHHYLGYKWEYATDEEWNDYRELTLTA